MTLRGAIESMRGPEKVPRVPPAKNHGEPLEAPPFKDVPQVPQVHRKKTKTFCALSIKGQSEPPPETDLDALAASIAAAHGVTAAQCLSILDDDDRQAIRAGSDPGRANAWRAAVASLVHRGAWLPLPGNERAALVTCETCAHARPAGPGLVDCAALVPAPGACGPFRRWATDLHHCEQWEG